MKCQNCGNEIPDHVRFCGYCGEIIQMAPTEVAQPTKKDFKSRRRGLHPLLKGVIGGLILMAVIGLGLVFYLRISANQTSSLYKSMDAGSYDVLQSASTETETDREDTTSSSDVTSTPSGTTSSEANGCSRVTFIADVTVPDGTLFGPGETFMKTWRLRNNGSCSWTRGFSLRYEGGTDMGADLFYPFNQAIISGEAVDVSAQLETPSSPGDYTAYWNLYDEDGNQVPLDGFDAFWTTIIVTLDPTPTIP